MEADVREADIEAETELLQELAKGPSGQIMGPFRRAVRNPPIARHSRCLSSARPPNPLIRGFRRVLHTQPDELASSERFRANLRLPDSAGSPFDLCVLPRHVGAGR